MNHHPRKRFGQNFLHDPNVIRNIIAAIYPQKDERLVEIGPGLGALTTPLLTAVGEMDAVELDRDLVPKLKQQCADAGTLRIHNADALKFDFCSLLQDHNDKLRVIGNLPYNISTPLIFHLLEQSGCIRDMHFMLQKEVVNRLAAEPGSGDYGRLSIMVQYRCHVEKLFSVPSGAFTPQPKVDSAIVRLSPYAQPPFPARDEKLFSRLVTRAFNQRRKTLRNNMKGWLDAATIETLGIDPGCRPETLSLEQFVALANAFWNTSH